MDGEFREGGDFREGNYTDGSFGDGGFTDWTAQLLGNRKERLLISGYGVERLIEAGSG